MQALALQHAGDRGLWSRAQAQQALVQLGQAPGRVMGAQHGGRPAQARLPIQQVRAPQGVQAPAQAVLALAQQSQARIGRLRLQSQRGAIGPLHGLGQAVALQGLAAPVQCLQACQQVAPVRNQQFGGHRRGRRAQVGGEIGQGEIGLVAHRRHHRHRRGGDGAHQRLVVERPQVFQRSAAAGQQHHLVTAAGRGPAQQVGDLRRGAFALHQAGQDIHFKQGQPARQHAEHIAHGRAGGRGDHRHPAHPGRQRSLARGIEQAFGRQSGLQCLEGAAQRAFAGLFEMVEHQLVVAARLVQGQAATAEHLEAFARHELQPLALGLEHGATHLRTRVLEGEVQVAGAGSGDVAQFALHPYQRKGALQQVARQGVELAGREDGRLLGHLFASNGGTG